MRWGASAGRTSIGPGAGSHVVSRVEGGAIELEPLAAEWRALEAIATSPTQHLIWSRSCAASFYDSRASHTIVARDQGRVTAVAPLVRTAGPIPRLELMGVRELFEPTDLLYLNASALEELAHSLARQPLPLLLMRLPASSPVAGALKRAFRGHGIVYSAPTSLCPFIDLDPTWTEPEKHFNSGRRSDFRRARRHAEQLGEVTFEVLAPAPQDVGGLLDDAVAVEASSWKGANGSALARDPVRGRFFRRYAVEAASDGILRLVFMRIAGRPVAMQIALECHQRFWLLKIGYDEGVSRCSPGNLLMLHSLKYAASRGLASYEFLGGVAPWTDVWTKTLRSCTVVRAYPFSVPGMSALAVDTGQWVWRRMDRRLRKPE
jgi:CelD/BcsL family acetyltransferase involved in cellulose biosynthesis